MVVSVCVLRLVGWKLFKLGTEYWTVVSLFLVFPTTAPYIFQCFFVNVGDKNGHQFASRCDN